jgi:hypothetical protein
MAVEEEGLVLVMKGVRIPTKARDGLPLFIITTPKETYSLILIKLD